MKSLLVLFLIAIAAALAPAQAAQEPPSVLLKDNAYCFQAIKSRVVACPKETVKAAPGARCYKAVGVQNYPCPPIAPKAPTKAAAPKK